MSNTKRFLSALIVLAAAFLLVAATGEKAPVLFGLSQASVFDVPVTDPIEPITTDPGERPRLGRPYDGSPPLIPHGIEGMEITWTDNLCLDCHLVESSDEGEPTAIPESHKRDMRRSPDEVTPANVTPTKVAGARYNCLLCHALPTSSGPLLGNRFKSD